MKPLIQLRKIQLNAAMLLLACFATWFNPNAFGVVPPPDGDYPNFNTAEGQSALFSLTTGQWNTALGAYTLWKNTDGSYNTAVGTAALLLNVGEQIYGHGLENTAVGTAALLLNTIGSQNVAVGTDALLSNNGSFNNAVGTFALFNNFQGFANNAFGYGSLSANIQGAGNTAIGDYALAVNDITGSALANWNTAVGTAALSSNSDGDSNTAVGLQALYNTTGGRVNTAIGAYALFSNTTGSSNVALGDEAGIGVVSGSNIICIGANVLGDDVSDTTWIGNIYGVATVSGTTAPVVVSDTGQLGTVVSSERFKKDIAGMQRASEAILSLRPVTFHYKADTKETAQFGLIAEEVAKVNRALVLPDKEGKPYTVRYDAVNAMLLNEFLKEHKTVQQQGQTIARLEKQIDALTASLQKVSAQLEVNKPAPQTVLNSQ